MLVRTLYAHVSTHAPNFEDGESVLTLLYEAYTECNERYQQMNGMSLRDTDKMIYPVWITSGQVLGMVSR